jgi:hypothetical protein
MKFYIFRIFFYLNPFSGISKLEQENPVSPDLHLLKCLELIHLDRPEDAKTSLDEYKRETEKSERHPLHLLALARLSADHPERKKQLTKFAEKYPLSFGHWLYDNENRILGNVLTGYLLVIQLVIIEIYYSRRCLMGLLWAKLFLITITKR